MKKISIFLSGLLMLLSLTACSNSKENEPYSSGNSVSENSSESSAQSSGSSDSTEKPSSTQSGTGSNNSTESDSTSTTPPQSSETSTEKTPPAQSGTESSTSTIPPQSSVISGTKPDPTQSTQTVTPSKPEDDPQTSDGKENSENMMNIKIGDDLLTATLEQNSSAKALTELLSNGPVTVHMSDYAGMEKVGTLPTSLPRNDEHIDTDACDLILYQGNQFVIYYDTNSWSLTRLGKINNVTKSELKKILGTGSVTAVLSLP